MTGTPPPGLAASTEAIDRFLDAVWLEDGLAALTRAAYRRDLMLYARWLAAGSGRALDQTRKADLQGYIAERHAGSRASTANRRLAVFRRYFRWALREQRNTRVLMADVREVDVTRRVVRVDDERREIPWDYLVLAAGARHSYFGHDAWEQVAPGLKSVDDALHIRNRFLLAFERAEKTTDDAERRALQTFVIVGGGPTGVELAGMLPTIATRTMKHEFRTIDPAQTRVILVEGGPRILPTFPEELATRARHDLEKLGVQVWTRSIVTSVDDRGVNMGDERLEAAMTVRGRLSAGRITA